MKKHRFSAVMLVVGMVAAFVPVTAQARRHYGRGGCGPGSLIFGPTKAQCSAASTNETLTYTNLFAMSSGTSNCIPNPRAYAEEQQQSFFVANFAMLSKEAAQGSGDSLAGFAGTLGCSQGREANVAASMKANYGSIFAQPGAVAAFDAALDSLREAPEVVAHCELL